VNNAGVGFGAPGAAREVSADGIELRFAVNHLASYLLARRLAELLVASAPARIVQVASAGQLALDPGDPLTERNYDGTTAYRRSKLAQVMAGYDLAADLVGTDVSVNSLHPATFMDTAMVRENEQTPYSTVAEGLEAVWRLVADPALDGVSGRYFNGTRQSEPDPHADDPAERAWVRQLSDDLIKEARAGSR
jgi:NAD(P)-dependent dehydrogenase (short-subunit alcohol dehydrogenase family)